MRPVGGAEASGTELLWSELLPGWLKSGRAEPVGSPGREEGDASPRSGRVGDWSAEGDCGSIGGATGKVSRGGKGLSWGSPGWLGGVFGGGNPGCIPIATGSLSGGLGIGGWASATGMPGEERESAGVSISGRAVAGGGVARRAERTEVSGKPAGAGVSCRAGVCRGSSVHRLGRGPVGAAGAAGALRSGRGRDSGCGEGEVRAPSGSDPGCPGTREGRSIAGAGSAS